MARISSYAQDQDITSADKLIGSDGGTTTKNYSIASISKYFKETNAAGVAGQFSWMLRTAGGHDSGEIKATFSSGLTFANLTSVKMSKFVYKETLNSVENGLSILNSKDILIANVNDFDTYGLFEAGTVTRDGSTDFSIFPGPFGGIMVKFCNSRRHGWSLMGRESTYGLPRGLWVIWGLLLGDFREDFLNSLRAVRDYQGPGLVFFEGSGFFRPKSQHQTK